MDLGSITCTTRPGKGPGIAPGAFGTFMKSSMLVSIFGGVSGDFLSSSLHAGGTPSTAPPAAIAEQVPIPFRKRRRSTPRTDRIESYLVMIFPNPADSTWNASSLVSSESGFLHRRINLRASYQTFAMKRTGF